MNDRTRPTSRTRCGAHRAPRTAAGTNPDVRSKLRSVLMSRAQRRKLPSAAPFVDATRKLDQGEQRWICEPRQNFEDHDWKRRSHKSQLVRLGRSAPPVSIKCFGSHPCFFAPCLTPPSAPLSAYSEILACALRWGEAPFQ